MQLDNLYNMLPKEYDGSTECDKNCSESKQEIIKRFLMADVMASLSEVKLGTLIRQYSDKIGFSFTNQPLQYQKINIDNWSTCNAIGNIENLIFETLEKLVTKFGLKATLHDIPTVFANGYNNPITQFYPLYSICSAGFERLLTTKLVSQKHKKIIGITIYLTFFFNFLAFL